MLSSLFPKPNHSESPSTKTNGKELTSFKVSLSNALLSAVEGYDRNQLIQNILNQNAIIAYRINDFIFMTGRIIAIYIAASKHGEQIAVDVVQVKRAKGIVGDRFFGLRSKNPGRNLTLIEAETIMQFNQLYQQIIPLHATRRNLITQDIRLNDLIGKTFRIGEVLCRGIELCEPCTVMARHFPNSSLSQTEIIRAFINKGGVRVEVLNGGIIRLEDDIQCDIGSSLYSHQLS